MPNISEKMVREWRVCDASGHFAYGVEAEKGTSILQRGRASIRGDFAWMRPDLMRELAAMLCEAADWLEAK